MSIVGTRPPLISETNLYEPHHKAMLLQKYERREQFIKRELLRTVMQMLDVQNIVKRII